MSMKMWAIAVLFTLLGTPAVVSAQTADVADAPTAFVPMPTLPAVAPDSSALDPSIAAALDEAEAVVTTDRLRAGEIAMSLVTSPDPFTVAQRPLFSGRVTELLKRLARDSEGREALVLSDAAWIAAGRGEDANHAQRLTQAAVVAKKDGKNAESLWLVRRALVAAPDYGDALELDRRLSNNAYGTVGWAMFWGGLGGLVASAVFVGMRGSAHKELTTVVHPRAEADQLLARSRVFGTLSLAALGVGLGSLFGSLGVLSAGSRSYRAVSPDDLPAAVEWK